MMGKKRQMYLETPSYFPSYDLAVGRGRVLSVFDENFLIIWIGLGYLYEMVLLQEESIERHPIWLDRAK